MLRNNDVIGIKLTVISENLSETGGESTAKNITEESVESVNWYKEPPFNYPDSELTNCEDPAQSFKEEKTCYAKVENFDDLGLVRDCYWTAFFCLLIG